VVVREEPGGVVCIGQPSHAWVSGQLARAWGNERFGAVEPREEVCLAAEQHDVGWQERDLEPALEPEGGRPRSFMQWDRGAHLELWLRAPRLVLGQSRYAALLVSLHGHALYARDDLSRFPAEPAERIRGFLAAQRAFQAELLEVLREDPVLAPFTTEAAVARNQRLLWTWDSLSLALCLDWAPHTLRDVPAAAGALHVALSAADDGRLTLHPWPFATVEVSVRCEGRRLTGTFDDEAGLRAAYAAAPPVTLTWTLLAA